MLEEYEWPEITWQDQKHMVTAEGLEGTRTIGTSCAADPMEVIIEEQEAKYCELVTQIHRNTLGNPEGGI